MTLSVNMLTMKLAQDAIAKKEELNLKVQKHTKGCTIIDAGIEAKGGYAAGRIITEICLGGLGIASLTSTCYGDITLPTIHIETDHPAIATLGSQFAGWRIKTEGFFAMGSGPARALSLKPKDLYDKIGYRDESDQAVIMLETDQLPTSEALDDISEKCGVEAENLLVVLAPSSSLTGSVQISGRIVETGVHKLSEVGLDPKKVLYGCGYAPIAPVHPKGVKAMGRTNDALCYGGVTFFTVDYEDDEELKEIVAKTPSSTSRDYGKPFYETFKAAGFDFYKIDPELFAPAKVMVNNVRTGKTYDAGDINLDILVEAMDINKTFFE